MSIFQAIIMGIVQGVTEFLPISSSGHLALIKNILGVNTDSGILFDILLHVATLIAIALVYSRDVIKLLTEFFKIIGDIFVNAQRAFQNLFAQGDPLPYRRLATSSYRRFVILLLITTIPTGILGVALKGVVEGVSGNLLVTGICLLGSGGILFLSDYIMERHKKPKDASWGDAAVIGVAQGVATLPGLTRSGSTIVAAMLCGFDKKFAVKYSFIASMPAVLGALILELFDLEGGITGSEVAAYILGMIFALLVGFVVLKFMIRLVMKGYFKYFAFYCFGIGAISIIAYIILL
ncbi:MAG: undecaprenyl-diphosphate phosphatase [Lachnospiraceae bacterium]|nr:undecaprenyl-diphosphate phosphatase [Lachnospiraceae bacterium]